MAAMIAFFGVPHSLAAAKDTYPKLASYYLNFFGESEYSSLSKFDLLIIPTEMVYLNNDFFRQYRAAKKDGLLISYVYPAMAMEYNPDESITLRNYVLDNINQRGWWLQNAYRERLEIWPSLFAVNVTDKNWQDFNVGYLKDKISIQEWDGIMYDTVDAMINHYNKNGGIDIDGDGREDASDTVNRKWQEGMAELFKKTRTALGSKIIMINGNSLNAYQPDINGRMFETFPTPWEGNGSWTSSMYQYLANLPGKNVKPNIYVLNGNTNNSGNRYDYRKMRFGLTSALLGDGYYSFDYGDKDHGQTWWYDEYDVRLGKAKSGAYNLLDKGDKTVKPGLWRRDFEYGISLVNSTDKAQKYVFDKEEFEKINGSQDRRINDGSKVNWVKIDPNDGVVLLKMNTEIENAGFLNGGFFRSFDLKGRQTRNGFFAYKDAYPGDTQILVSDIDNDGDNETLVNGRGMITVYDNGVKKASFAPYGPNFKGEISFAVGDLNCDRIKEIITGPGRGGGPQIRVFSASGKLLSSGFFAFDKNSRKGVSVAAGDIDNDGSDEIIVGAGAGESPKIRIFNKDGRLIREFLAYDKGFRGGVNVASGDMDGDGLDEIAAGPGAGGGPHVRIFKGSGRLAGQFFAYDKSSRSGVRVLADDINNDGLAEILASSDIFTK